MIPWWKAEDIYAKAFSFENSFFSMVKATLLGHSLESVLKKKNLRQHGYPIVIKTDQTRMTRLV
jgi:hypothetical protein